MATAHDIVGRGHMKDAFVMLVALAFAAGFVFLICHSGAQYFTTWALALHVTYFLACVVDNAWFVENGSLARWGFAPGFCVAITVAAGVAFIMTSQWEATYERYCNDSQACYDLMLEFFIAHYTPPFAYLFIFVLGGAVIKPGPIVLPWWYHWMLLWQLSLFPACIWATFFDMNVVYGEGTKPIGMPLFGTIAAIWSLMWCLCLKD